MKSRWHRGYLSLFVLDRKESIFLSGTFLLYKLLVELGIPFSDPTSIVRVIRENTSVPCAIGFGISTPEQAKKMADLSDGAIVGSAIVKFLEKHGKDAPEYIGEYVKMMKSALS